MKTSFDLDSKVQKICKGVQVFETKVVLFLPFSRGLGSFENGFFNNAWESESIMKICDMRLLREISDDIYVVQAENYLRLVDMFVLAFERGIKCQFENLENIIALGKAR